MSLLQQQAKDLFAYFSASTNYMIGNICLYPMRVWLREVIKLGLETMTSARSASM